MEANTAKPMTIRDTLIYVTLFIVITWAFALVSTRWLERLTAQTVCNVLKVFGFLSDWGVQNGEAYLSLVGENRLVVVTIIRECTAINVFAVVVGMIVPLKYVSLVRKGLSIAFSSAVLFLMNISRIMLTVYLTGFNVPPFSWYFTNPSVEVYHYPISFSYGVIGVAILILALNKWIMPELGDTLLGVMISVLDLVK